ncbi:hypothetical protein BBI01_10640 [Chryseobacterium artocarpi]|uniref:Uncharacterized protein n=1 Tax=Chryseobacterium artocarpi TaxID=1414727 RepID=A0A1B8ZLS9_9FLAO|nr:hypothetical protein BBI01_10640 [Chryseobacterium artocarpi]
MKKNSFPSILRYYHNYKADLKKLFPPINQLKIKLFTTSKQQLFYNYTKYQFFMTFYFFQKKEYKSHLQLIYAMHNY